MTRPSDDELVQRARIPVSEGRLIGERVLRYLRAFPRSSSRQICAAIELHPSKWKVVRGRLGDRLVQIGAHRYAAYSAKE